MPRWWTDYLDLVGPAMIWEFVAAASVAIAVTAYYLLTAGPPPA